VVDVTSVVLALAKGVMAPHTGWRLHNAVQVNELRTRQGLAYYILSEHSQCVMLVHITTVGLMV
jgi:hypothetical protein